MNLKSYLPLILVLIPIFLFGQVSDELRTVEEETGFGYISEESKSMNKGINNALVLELPDSDSRLVEKLWKKYLRQFKGTTKKVKRSDELYTESADIASLSTDLVNLYSGFSERGNNAYLSLWIELEEDNYLSSHERPDAFAEVENILTHFAQQVRKENIRLELLEEEKKLKRLDVTLRKLERNNENYHKEIEAAKARIAKAEDNIIKNTEEQETTRQLILQQQDVVAEVKERLKKS